MIRSGIVFFAVFIVTKNVQSNCATKSSDRDIMSFRKTDENLETLANQVFKLLNVNTALWEANKTKILLAIHNHSQQISKNNLEAYKDIEIANKVDFDTPPSNLFFNLTKVLNNALKFLTKKRFNHLNQYKILNRDFFRVINQSDIVKTVNYTELMELNEIIARVVTLNLWQSSNSTEDEDLINQTRRIYHGKPTKNEKYPFMASIHVMREFMCGGAIISKDLVITAASCVNLAYEKKNKPGDPNFLAIRVGSHYSQRFGELIPIFDIFFHPSYEPGYLRNNLAIAQIRILRFRTDNLKVMKIGYKQKEQLNDDVKIMMLGWGDKDTDISGKFDPLSMTKLNMYNLQSCMDIYTRAFVDDNNFCAGYTDIGSGACSRDVGGPAIVNGVLVGVVSFGPPQCGTPGAPTVFTRIEHYVDWIDSVVNKTPFPATTSMKPADQPALPSELSKVVRFGSELIQNNLSTSTPKKQSQNTIPISSTTTEDKKETTVAITTPFVTPAVMTHKKPPIMNKTIIDKLRNIMNNPEILLKLKEILRKLGKEQKSITKQTTLASVSKSGPREPDNTSNQPHIIPSKLDNKAILPHKISSLLDNIPDNIPIKIENITHKPEDIYSPPDDKVTRPDNIPSQPATIEEIMDSGLTSDNLETEEISEEEDSESNINRNILRELTKPEKNIKLHDILKVKVTTKKFPVLDYTFSTKSPLEWEIEPDIKYEISRKGSHGSYSRRYHSSPKFTFGFQRQLNAMNFKSRDEKKIGVDDKGDSIREYYEYETDDNEPHAESGRRSILDYIILT